MLVVKKDTEKVSLSPKHRARHLDAGSLLEQISPLHFGNKIEGTRVMTVPNGNSIFD